LSGTLTAIVMANATRYSTSAAATHRSPSRPSCAMHPSHQAHRQRGSQQGTGP
jgi:hypothetical protein